MVFCTGNSGNTGNTLISLNIFVPKLFPSLGTLGTNQDKEVQRRLTGGVIHVMEPMIDTKFQRGEDQPPPSGRTAAAAHLTLTLGYSVVIQHRWPALHRPAAQVTDPIQTVLT